MSRSEAGAGAGTDIRQSHITVRRSARYAVLGEPSEAIERVWFVCHGYRQLAARFLRRFRALDDDRTLVVAPEALNRFYLDEEPGPHGPESRVGGTWMTREDRQAEIGDYVYYLDALYARVMSELGVEVDALVNASAGTLAHEPSGAAEGEPSGSPAETAPETAEATGASTTQDAAPGRAGAPLVHVLGFSQGAATASRWAAYGRARIDRLTLWSGLPAHDLDLGSAAERMREMDLTLVLGENDEYTRVERAERARTELGEHGIDATLLTFPGGHRIDPDALEELERPRSRSES